jgi:hypothetical protein
MHALLRGAQSAPRGVVVAADTTPVSATPRTTQALRCIQLDHRSRRAASFRTLLGRRAVGPRREGDVAAAGDVARVGVAPAAEAGESGVADPPVAAAASEGAGCSGVAGAVVAPRRAAGERLECFALLADGTCLFLAADDACRARGVDASRDAVSGPVRPAATAGEAPRGVADGSGIVKMAGEDRAGAAGAGRGTAGATAGGIGASMFAEPRPSDSTPTPIPSPPTSISGTATISWCTVSRTGSPRSRAGQGFVVRPQLPQKPHQSHERCAR